MSKRIRLLIGGGLLWVCGAHAAESMKDVIGRMAPYVGKHQRGVDTSTLTGKVMCGYQGWFAASGDGSGRGWSHYAGKRGKLAPGSCTFDLWPDLTDMDADEKYITSFRHANGEPAYLFSPYNPKTVNRHFEWMKSYGIDGAFLQRFGSRIKRPRGLAYRNAVTRNVQAAANAHGRTWAMMYDLSGLKAGDIESVVMQDWKHLKTKMKITEDKSYLHHNGKPVIAVWGVGFGDDRKYTLAECERLVRFLKHNPEFGGCTVMLGVPTYWRTLRRDSVTDEHLHRIMALADVISPWSVGRYDSPASAQQHAETVLKPDIAWAAQRKIDFLPVVFPGFSWQNLKKTKGEAGELAQIPRLKGQFLWSQAMAAKKAGAKMVYVAMFDEVDEGTAIFKCTNNPPVGESRFLTYEGLPSDYYLWLTGRIGQLLNGKMLTLGKDRMPIYPKSGKSASP